MKVMLALTATATVPCELEAAANAKSASAEWPGLVFWKKNPQCGKAELPLCREFLGRAAAPPCRGGDFMTYD
jgi:hypothetical protein